MTPEPLSHAAIEELLGAYVLDAVDPDERDAIEAHLSTCPRCRAEVDAGREVSAGLAGTGGPAPAGVWDRIAESIGGEAPPPLRLVAATTPEPVVPARQTGWRRTLLGIVAVAAALAIVALSVTAIRQQNELDDMTGARDLAVAATAAFGDDDARQSELRDAEGQLLATAAVLPDGNGFLRAERLPSIDEGVYQLWGATTDQLVSLGVFDDDQDLIAFHADDTMSELLVTHEDEPVDQPQQEPLVAGDLT